MDQRDPSEIARDQRSREAESAMASPASALASDVGNGADEQVEFFDPAERAREKQRSRDEDARALASGEKTIEQLFRENCLFCFDDVRLNLIGSDELE